MIIFHGITTDLSHRPVILKNYSTLLIIFLKMKNQVIFFICGKLFLKNWRVTTEKVGTRWSKTQVRVKQWIYANIATFSSVISSRCTCDFAENLPS